MNAAQRYIASKGFEQMTIDDVLTELHISKGAFYHYFSSKGVLLEALITRMGDEAKALLLPILQDPDIPAAEKLQRWFEYSARWKSTRKDLLLSLMRSWYHDDNAVVRAKLRTSTWAWLEPMLTRIVLQGIQEGAFSTPYPEQVAVVVYSLIYDLGDSLAGLLLSEPSDPRSFASAEGLTRAFTETVERALGAPPGSLSLVDYELLRAWFTAPIPPPEVSGEPDVISGVAG
jgi:AcrR family transcriptional regulator